MIQQVEEALSDARGAGLNPSDIHLRNLILTETGAVRVIDVARFEQTKTCTQWDDLKSAYHALYKNRYSQKDSGFWLEIIAFLYKKDWFQKRFAQRKENILNSKGSRSSGRFVHLYLLSDSRNQFHLFR